MQWVFLRGTQRATAASYEQVVHFYLHLRRMLDGGENSAFGMLQQRRPNFAWCSAWISPSFALLLAVELTSIHVSTYDALFAWKTAYLYGYDSTWAARKAILNFHEPQSMSMDSLLLGTISGKMMKICMCLCELQVWIKFNTFACVRDSKLAVPDEFEVFRRSSFIKMALA